MPTMQRSGLLFAAGGDVLAKYGTLTRRYQIAQRGGEGLKETFARVGTAWAVGPNGLLRPYAANFPRVEYAIDPVTGLLQPHWLLEAAGTNLIENADCEADIVGYQLINGAAISRDNAQAFNGAWSCKVVTVLNTLNSGVQVLTRAGARYAAVVGTTYTFSAWIFADAGAVGKHLKVELDWYNGGAFLSGNVAGTILVAGWQRLSVTAIAPASTTLVQPLVAANSGAEASYNFWLDVPQLEASAFATSAIATGVGAVIRNTELATVPCYLSPLPTAGDLWFYLRFLERGTALGEGAGFPTVMNLQGAGGNWRSLIYHGAAASGPYNVVTQGNDTFAAGATATVGQVIELLAFFRADTSVAIRQAANGGTEFASVGPVQVGAAAPFTYGAGPIVTIGPSAGNPAHLALSRALMGLGAGTLVQTLADARAIPV